MAGLNEHVGGIEAIPRAVTGRQSYFLDVTGPANGCEISVVSFSTVERIGEPYRVIVEIAHPGSLSHDDYLGRDGMLSFGQADAGASRSCAWAWARCHCSYWRRATAPLSRSRRLPCLKQATGG